MLRKAKMTDIEQLVEWVWIILEDMELTLLKEIDTDTLKQLMKEAMKDENYRYSYHRARICIREGERAGVCFGYKGELEPTIDEALNEKLKAQGIEEVLFQDSETVPGEWYLDSLVTDVNFRGQGVASELLKALFKVPSCSSFILCPFFTSFKVERIFSGFSSLIDFKIVGIQE